MAFIIFFKNIFTTNVGIDIVYYNTPKFVFLFFHYYYNILNLFKIIHNKIVYKTKDYTKNIKNVVIMIEENFIHYSTWT